MNKKGMNTVQGIIVAAVIIAAVGALFFIGGYGGGGGGSEAPEEIKIGWSVPISGYLANFGEPDRWVANTLETRINEDGGIYLSKYDTKVPIRIIVRDTESDTRTASEVAADLATREKVDMFLVMHTPDTTIPVCAEAERHGIPTVSLDSPMEAWLSGAPSGGYDWSYHTFWSNYDVAVMFKNIWDGLDTNKVVVGLWSSSPDGKAWKNAQKPLLENAGYEVVVPGSFPPDLQDFSSIVSTFKNRNVEIVAGTLPTPAFQRFMDQCVTQNYNPPVVTVGKSNLFPPAVNSLGSLSKGLTQELWWSPYHPYESSLTGQSAEEIANAYEESTGRQWSPPLGYAHAGIEIVVDSIKRAGCLAAENLRNAIANTDLETVVGPVDFKDIPEPNANQPEIIMNNRKQVSISPVVMSQWVPGDEWKWKQEIIYNWKYDNIPETAEPVFPKLWS